MAPKAQKEPSWIGGPTEGFESNQYINNWFTWGQLELQKNSNIGWDPLYTRSRGQGPKGNLAILYIGCELKANPKSFRLGVKAND
jgi:hypothetical protein